jgi:DNA-binding NarL/FixJ family response regulator
MISVLLVDDHAVVTEGLTVLLGGFEDLEVVGTANGGAAAVERYAELRPDVVLMDLSMPEVDGVAATRRIVELHPEARIIALTAFIEENQVSEALAAGARGYLLKNASGAELHTAIRSVAGGASILSDEALAQLTSPRPEPRPGTDLTPREREVLHHLIRGLSNKQIAAELGLRHGTIRIHVSKILAKLGAENRTEAAHIARRIGLSDL